MKIICIGTSHGVPEGDRRCSCYLIEVDGNRYFIDMGTQAIEDLRKRHVPIESVKGIFITHMHGDHTDGLLSFVDICNWYFKDANPRIVLPEQVGIDAIKAWILVNHNVLRNFDFQVTQEGLVYNDGVVQITAFKTQHIEPSYAYLLEAEGKRVLFTGDLKNPQIDFPLAAVQGERTDLVLGESAHFSSLDYLGVLYEHDIQRLYITHYQPKLIPDVWKLKDRVNVQVELAMDGMEIEL